MFINLNSSLFDKKNLLFKKIYGIVSKAKYNDLKNFFFLNTTYTSSIPRFCQRGFLFYNFLNAIIHTYNYGFSHNYISL